MKDRPCEITQHSKKDPLTIKCEVLLSPLLSNIAPKSITLKITASPEDWKVLYSEDPQYLGNLIWLYFANQAMKKISPNIHKEQDVWLNKAKAYAGCVHTWASYWFKKPSDERPDTFKSEFDLSLVNDGQTDYLNMDRITADHMERIFGEGRKRYGLAEWITDNDATTAFREYLKERGNPHKQVAKYYLKENLYLTPKEYYQKLFAPVLGLISELI